MLDRILVPLDGSRAAAVALKIVEQIPSRNIELLGVEPDSTDLSEMCIGGRDREAYLEVVAAPLRNRGRDVTTMVAFGNPAEQINAMADGADLIVMSSHGYGALGRVLFGSVADPVARNAPAPTLIVRGDQWQATALKRIVVPLDGSPLSEQSLPLAVSLARDMALPLHLVRVIDFDLVEATVVGGLSAAEACARQQAELARDARAYLVLQSHRYQTPDCVITSEVLIGYPVGEIIATVQPEDLTVLTTHARGGIARWMIGSVAEEVVRHGAGPVLLVRASTETSPAQTEATDPAGHAA
jgi:nucleotide-binding universal stress UspA family protein